MRILLTGATGFVGQCLLFMLLRRSDLTCVYVVARAGRGKAAQDRIASALMSMGMRREEMDSRLKVLDHSISDGPLTESHFATENGTPLTEVDFVVNCAASVRFDLSREEAIHQNLGIVKCVWDTVKMLKNVKRVIHVSTAYVNPHPDTGASSIMRFASTAAIDAFVNDPKQPLGYHPNTYTLSKNLSEEWIRLACEEEKMPLAIVRPSIVTGSVKYPYAGWVGDSPAGYHAFLIAFARGVLDYFEGPEHARLQIVPVDICCEVILQFCRDPKDDDFAESTEDAYEQYAHTQGFMPLYNIEDKESSSSSKKRNDEDSTSTPVDDNEKDRLINDTYTLTNRANHVQQQPSVVPTFSHGCRVEPVLDANFDKLVQVKQNLMQQRREEMIEKLKQRRKFGVICDVVHAALEFDHLWPVWVIGAKSYKVSSKTFTVRGPNCLDKAKEVILRGAAQAMSVYWRLRGNQRKAQYFANIWDKTMRMKEVYNYFSQRQWHFASAPGLLKTECYELYCQDIEKYHHTLYDSLVKRFC